MSGRGVHPDIGEPAGAGYPILTTECGTLDLTLRDPRPCRHPGVGAGSGGDREAFVLEDVVIMSVDAVTPDTDLRARALERLKKKRDFKLHLAMYVMFNSLLILVWVLTATGFFWPVFPLAGWGIGIVAHAWDAYGREPSEAQIRREIDHLR